MRFFITIIILIILLATGFTIYKWFQNEQIKKIPDTQIRYVALGDSYTIGDGVRQDENLPNQLTKHLQSEGFMVALIANPAVSGRTSQDVLGRQLEILRSSNPTFATLLIGTNDIIQGINAQNFRENFSKILDQMIEVLPEKKIIILTIPAFSATPYGARLSQGTLIEAVIIQYNKIIKEEAEKRNLKVVDIFGISKEMGSNPSLVADDGLHPSAKEYKEWEKLLFPVSYNLLTSL